MAADKKNRDELELERYGVWVKAGPDELDDHDMTSLELMDIEDSGNDELLITEEEEKLLGELEESALPDFSDFDDSFDIDVDEEFEASGLNEDIFGTTTETPAAAAISDDGESKELLLKIEDDLNALREEIRQLKDELTGLRVPAVSPVSAENADSGGFFEEEDDETIALTGDELDNILDSADMTEERPLSESVEGAVQEQKLDIGLEMEDEEVIDLSSDFTESADDDFGVFEVDDSPDESDPALSILGSPDEPLEIGDPETIEIDIPGVDETINLDDAPEEDILEMDDVEIEDIDLDDFEEISDLDDFDISDDVGIDIPLMDESPEEILVAPSNDIIMTENFDEEVFDEGEEVEIDLTGMDDQLDGLDESDALDIEMEEISLDDFGIEEDESVISTAEDENSDVLAIDDFQIEDDVDLTALDAEDIEEVELETILADGIEEEAGLEDFEDLEEMSLDDSEEISMESLVEAEDLEIEEIDLMADESILETVEEPQISDIKDAGGIEIEDFDLEENLDAPEIEAISLEEEEHGKFSDIEDIEIEDISFDDSDFGIEDLSSDEGELELEELVSDDNEIEIGDIEALSDIEALDEIPEIPELAIDDAIEEIETVEEFSLDEIGGDDESIENLSMEIDNEEEIQVTLPDDDFNELPGTEEVDLDSLEALAAAPDMTELSDDDFIELPEIDDEIPAMEELDEILPELAEIEELSPEIEEIAPIELDSEIGIDDELEAVEDLSLDEFDDVIEGLEPEIDDVNISSPASFADQAKAALELESLPGELKDEIKEVLKYMDQLLESLPDDKIQEFARSEHFEVYKKIFEELGISD